MRKRLHETEWDSEWTEFSIAFLCLCPCRFLDGCECAIVEIMYVHIGCDIVMPNRKCMNVKCPLYSFARSFFLSVLIRCRLKIAGCSTIDIKYSQKWNTETSGMKFVHILHLQLWKKKRTSIEESVAKLVTWIYENRSFFVHWRNKRSP